MIYDKLDNFDRYARLFPEQWAKVKEFFAEGVTPAPGRYELMPDGRLFINVQEYAPHLYDEEKVEYHKNYIDIQLLLLGEEEIVYTSREGLEEVTPYNAENDCGFDRLPAGKGTALKMKVGDFAVFFPDEGHEPCVGDPASSVLKAVVKLKAD